MTGREIYGRLRWCAYFEITARVYKSWIKADRHLIGFDARIVSKEKDAKTVMLPRIQIWCDEAKIPVKITDVPHLKTTFKIELIK